MGVRQYYIDWLRIILILSVFLYHIGMIFSDMHWHVKNETEIEGMNNLLSFLHIWRIPLLFLVSGVSSYYSLGLKSSKLFLKERAKRLIIPFITGIFILVPIQVYLEKSHLYDSLFGFYPHFFDGIYPSGNFTWSHLWFIFYLFIFTLVISPFLNLLRSKKSRQFQEKLIRISEKTWGLNVLLLPVILTQTIIYPYLPDASHYTYDFFFFVFGLFLFSNSRIMQAVKNQRELFLIETIFLTLIYFSPNIINFGVYEHQLVYFSSSILALSCSLTALGYAKEFLNKDSKYRKMVNEAIYPFYLLQQPVIVVIGYYILPLNMSAGTKLVTIAFIAFGFSIGIYWFIIRPINVFRFLFGMKMIKVKRTPVPLPIAIFDIIYPPKHYIALNHQYRQRAV